MLIWGASLDQQRQKPGCRPGRPLGTSLSRLLGLCSRRCPLSPPQRLLVRWHCRPEISGERKLQRAPAGLSRALQAFFFLTPAVYFSPQLPGNLDAEGEIWIDAAPRCSIHVSCPCCGDAQRGWCLPLLLAGGTPRVWGCSSSTEMS